MSSVQSLVVGMTAPQPDVPLSQEDIKKDWSLDETPLVTVVCHTYNHVEFISSALDGILTQRTSFPFEIIVHDDASTDGTQSVIRAYCDRYPDIIKPIFQTANQYSRGLKPIQFTMTAAMGKYIAFCEGDDYWMDQRKLQIQANFLENNPGYSICGHDAFIFEGDTVVSVSKVPDEAKRSASSDELARGIFGLILTAMFRNHLEPHPPELSHILNGDVFLFSRLGQFGAYMYLDEIYPAAYRKHDGGVWSSISESQKAGKAVTSCFWVSQYYKRNHNNELATHFAFSGVHRMLGAIDSLSFKDIFSLNIILLKQLLRRKHPVFVAKAIKFLRSFKVR